MNDNMNDGTYKWLVDVIKIQRCIWNVKHPLYDDYESYINAWDEIYNTCIPEYKYMNFKNKKEAHRLMQKGLKRAKEIYPGLQMVNENKKMDVDESLLAKHPDYRPTGHHICGHNYGRFCELHGIAPYFLYDDQSLLIYRNNEDETTRNLLKSVKDCLQKLQNEDMIFFMSLMPTISMFTDYQRLIFRSEMLKRAFEITNYHYSSFNVPPPSAYPDVYMPTSPHSPHSPHSLSPRPPSPGVPSPRTPRSITPRIPSPGFPPPRAPRTPAFPSKIHSPPPRALSPAKPQRNAELPQNDQYPFFDPRNIALPPGYRPLSPELPQRNI